MDLLSPNQIISVPDKYLARIATYGANLVSFFRFTDAAGTTQPVNTVSTFLNGTANGVTFGQPRLHTGSPDKACSFPGVVGSSVNAANASAYNLSATFTLELWMKYTGNVANQWFIGKDLSGSRAYSFGLVTAAGNYKLNAQINGTNIPIGTTNLVAGTVYHVSMTYDGTNARGYLNGVLETAGLSAAPAVTGNSVFIGQREFVGFEEPFLGTMNHVAFYNRVLTAPELLGNYQAGI